MSYQIARQTVIQLKKAKKLGRFHIDSRLIQANDCFVALKGEQQDGHDFIDHALDAGAALVLSERAFNHPKVICLPNLADDLASLAKDIQNHRSYQTIALTGSVGKTTTRHMLYQVLSQTFQVSMAYGNYNNEVGVPLTVLSAELDDDFLIIEMGAAKPGDIEYLMNMVQVDCGLSLPLVPVHFSNYDSFEQLVYTKSFIYRGLSAKASAVIDLDQPQADEWQMITKARPVLIGVGGEIQCHVDQYFLALNNHDEVLARFSMKQVPAHLVTNIKLCVGVLCALGLSIKMIEGLEGYHRLPGRLYHYALGNFNLYDDSYNASVLSAKAAIDELALSHQKKILVFGSMGELGKNSKHDHQQVGEYANGRVDELIAVGQDAYITYEAFIGKKRHIASPSMFDAQWVCSNSAVVVKGSRFMRMEKIVKQLLSHFGGEYVS